MNHNHHSKNKLSFMSFKSRPAFTIVELLIVVVVIAILAAIVLVAFNGVRSRAIDSAVKNTLSSAAKTFETKKIENSAYPTSLSAVGIDSNDTVRLQYTGTETEYCISGTSPKSNTIGYRVSNQNPEIQVGVCEGHDGPGPAEEEEVFSFAKTVNGSGPLGFKIHVGEDWSAAEISWQPQEGALRYELQSRNPSSYSGNVNTFYYRNTSDGGGVCMGGCNYPSTSGGIPASTTSLTWNSDIAGIPKSTGQTFEYRLRYQKADTTFSDWDTISLANPIDGAEDLRDVKNFKVTPNAGYTNVTISWDQAPNFSPRMDQVWYEVQSRNPSSANANVNTFYYRDQNGGNSTTAAASQNWSGASAYTKTSLTWTDTNTGVPSSTGQNFEYRIRVRAQGEQTYNTNWSEPVTLSYPIQSDSDLPAVSGFVVTPSSSFASATLSWNRVADFAPKMSEVWYEVQSRNPSSANGYNNTFYYRDGTGGSYTTAAASQNWSGASAYTKTSLTWTDTNTGVPSSTGQVFEYKIRLRAQGEKTYHSPWSDIVSLAHPVQSDSNVPTISNFKVTPNAGYTNVTISWDQAPNFSPRMDQVWYEVQSRNPSSANGYNNTFYYRDGTGGSYTTAAASQNWSGASAYTKTSLTWTNTNTGVPQAGQTFEYRARIRVQGEKTFYSNWVTKTLTR